MPKTIIKDTIQTLKNRHSSLYEKHYNGKYSFDENNPEYSLIDFQLDSYRELLLAYKKYIHSTKVSERIKLRDEINFYEKELGL